MGMFLSFCGGILLFHLSNYFPFSVALVLVAGTAAALIKKKRVWMLIALLAVLYAGYRVPPPLAPFTCPDTLLRAQVTEHAVQGEFGYRQSAVVRSAAGCNADIAGRDIMLFTPVPLDAWTTGVFRADIKGTPPYRNPQTVRSDTSLKASVRHLLDTDEGGIMRVVGKERHRLHEHFHRTFSPEVAAVLDAVITGDRRSLSERVRRAFSATGLAHLLAISGTHFGIFSLLLFSSLTFVIRRLPDRALVRLTLVLKPSEAAAILSIPFMVFYLLVSGAAIPAVRSFLMINVFLAGYLLGRTGIWKNTLAFAATVLLLISPDALASPSFVLSFAAVAAIGFALDMRKDDRGDPAAILDLPEPLLIRLRTRGMDILTVTAAAFIGTLPVSLYLFHVFPSFSLITNMVLTPLICFLLIPLSLLGSGIYLVTGIFPFAPVVESGTSLILGWIHSLADVPGASLPVRAFPAVVIPGCYLGLSLLVMKKTRIYGISVVAVCLAVIAAYSVRPRPERVEVTFLDTGQAESSVATFPDGKTMVIDTGRDGTQTVGYLDYLGITAVDALFLTHAGSDHAGGLGHLLAMKTVRTLVDNGRIAYTRPPPDTMRHLSLGRGDVVEGAGYTLTILHPSAEVPSPAGSAPVNGNNDSLVIRIEHGGFSMLLTGDIEASAEADLTTLTDRIRSDILKVAHHGSATSSTGDFLFFVRPSLAIISAGMFNPYGHPHAITMERLSGIPTLNTADHGAITVSTGTKGISVKTFEGHRFRRPLSLREEMGNYRRLFLTW